MKNALYNFGKVEAKEAQPTVVDDGIRVVLRFDDSAAYTEMEPFLLAPGITGSKWFDQSRAVQVLLQHDLEMEGPLNKIMKETPALTEHAIWKRLSIVLKKAGFSFRQGRLVGLIESKTEDDENIDPEGTGNPNAA